MTRVLYQLPGKLDQVLGSGVITERQAFLNRNAGDGLTVEVRANPGGPDAIQSVRDAAIAVPGIMDGIAAAEREGFAGAINGCFSDPGMSAIRQSVRMPVVGPGACAFQIAVQLGDRFSILSPTGGGTRGRAELNATGIDDRLASVRPIGLSVIEIARNREQALERAIAAGRLAVEQDGADTIVLGCMSLAFQDASTALQDGIGVPVVNPVVASLMLLRTLIHMNLSHSPVAYPMPPEAATARH
ncbi:MAG: aspartate/glutamate racemase family protein [Lautropia sp.]